MIAIRQAPVTFASLEAKTRRGIPARDPVYSPIVKLTTLLTLVLSRGDCLVRNDRYFSPAFKTKSPCGAPNADALNPESLVATDVATGRYVPRIPSGQRYQLGHWIPFFYPRDPSRFDSAMPIGVVHGGKKPGPGSSDRARPGCTCGCARDVKVRFQS
jgi:hypothetical protein